MGAAIVSIDYTLVLKGALGESQIDARNLTLPSNGDVKMKTFLSAILLAALSAGLAGTSYAQYGACVGNNSKHCVDARNAFAEHHGGVFPEQYFNHYHQGRPERWTQQNNAWRWDGMDGDRYSKGPHGWEWRHHHHR